MSRTIEFECDINSDEIRMYLHTEKLEGTNYCGINMYFEPSESEDRRITKPASIEFFLNKESLEEFILELMKVNLTLTA